jgi:hypothetical protein
MNWFFGKTSLVIKNPTIYNLIPWLTEKAGQKTHRPSIIFILLFLINFGHSKLFKDKLKQFLKRILQEIARKNKYLEHQMLGR